MLLLATASSPDVHVELSNLMGILARSRHFNGSSPVKVEVAERESKLLDVRLGELRLVERNMEVSWQDTTLVRRSWSHEEIEDFVFSLVTGSLNHT